MSPVAHRVAGNRSMNPILFSNLQLLIMGSEVHDDREGAVLAATSGSVEVERSLASGVLSSTRTDGPYVRLVETKTGNGACAHSKAKRGRRRDLSVSR